MLTFAVEREYIEVHPLLRFRMLPEEQKALRVLTLEEERGLVEAVADVNPTIGAYIAVLALLTGGLAPGSPRRPVSPRDEPSQRAAPDAVAEHA